MRGRIALVASGFPKLSETFIVQKFAGLAANGRDVHVVCDKSERSEWRRLAPPLRRPELRRRVHRNWPHRPRALAAALLVPALVRCAVRRPRGTWRYLSRGWRRFGAGVLRWLYLDAELVVLAPEIVHFEFGSLAAGRMHLGELLGCRVVVSFRGYDLNFVGLDEPEYYREVWNRADAIHLLGEDLWKEARRRGCPAGKPHVLIPPAVDVEFFRSADEADEDAPGGGGADRPLRVLSVGRLEWKKGYEYGLRAVRRLLDKGVHCEYRIVGDGEYRGMVAFNRHLLDLEERVALLGARTREETREQLQWADVFLHSAVSEGFCNAVVEAQSMGLPVVCSDAGGLPENVADGETGFVVPRRSPEALAEKLEVLARDPLRRRRMGSQGRRRSAAIFRIETQLAAFESLYDRVLAGRREAGPENAVAPTSSAREVSDAG